VISIQDNPRFKKDCEKYNKAIKECSNEILKSELKSLYDQFLKLVKQLDQGLIMLTTEGVLNNTQQTDVKAQLQQIRSQLEKKITK
jgi:hypothetical protein